MKTQNSRQPSRFDAIPRLHIGILTFVFASTMIAIFLLPETSSILRSEKFILPDEVLGTEKMLTVKSGDSLSTIGDRAGLTPTQVHDILNSGEEANKLLSIYPGQKIFLFFDKYGQFTKLRFKPSVTETLEVTQIGNIYEALYEQRELETRLRFAQGTINDSLFLASRDAGLDDNMTMELADIFGWDIDFVLDIRGGDSFNLLFEEKYLDDLKVKNGNILAANFVNQGKQYTAIRYEDSKGKVDYFTPEGLSMRKTFRRNPLDIVRITSKFNLRRKHPILHKIRAHKGVDYAASRGTPIRATGDGKVINARRKGGWGNAVIIQHGQKYTTLYAHLSKYGRGVKEGRHVKQGQIIGYVGSTGLATGPHLHYEFRVNGVHRNPLTIKLPHAKPIKKEEKESYLIHAENVQDQLFEYLKAANTDKVSPSGS